MASRSVDQLKSSKWSKTSPMSDLDKIRIECGIDEDFRKTFLSDPARVLKDHGIDVPEGLEIKVVQDTHTMYHINIPPYRGNKLTAEAVEVTAGRKGTTWCTTCTATTPFCFGSLASLTCA